MSQDPGKALKQMRQKLSLLPIRSGFVSPAEIEKKSSNWWANLNAWNRNSALLDFPPDLEHDNLQLQYRVLGRSSSSFCRNDHILYPGGASEDPTGNPANFKIAILNTLNVRRFKTADVSTKADSKDSETVISKAARNHVQYIYIHI